jgi:hypothetical protein
LADIRRLISREWSRKDGRIAHQNVQLYENYLAYRATSSRLPQDETKSNARSFSGQSLFCAYSRMFVSIEITIARDQMDRWQGTSSLLREPGNGQERAAVAASIPSVTAELAGRPLRCIPVRVA